MFCCSLSVWELQRLLAVDASTGSARTAFTAFNCGFRFIKTRRCECLRRVLIPKNVIYIYHEDHEDHEGLEETTALTSCVILRRLIKHSALNSSPVGRNKAFRASARTSVSGTPPGFAGNATTRCALRQAQDRLGWSYSGLLNCILLDKEKMSRGTRIMSRPAGSITQVIIFIPLGTGNICIA